MGRRSALCRNAAGGFKRQTQGRIARRRGLPARPVLMQTRREFLPPRRGVFEGRGFGDLRARIKSAWCGLLRLPRHSRFFLRIRSVDLWRRRGKNHCIRGPVRCGKDVGFRGAAAEITAHGTIHGSRSFDTAKGLIEVGVQVQPPEDALNPSLGRHFACGPEPC